jgi:hypothetical protein
VSKSRKIRKGYFIRKGLGDRHQQTHWWSLNHCTFCGACLEKPFHYRNFNEILVDIALAQQMMQGTRLVFLDHWDALVLTTELDVVYPDSLFYNT